MNNDVLQWLSFAQEDLAVARHLLATFRPEPMEIICYHCQQAAEKAIKSVYIISDVPGGVPRKHDLTFLLEQLKNSFEVSEALLDHADILSAYGVVVRYPAEIQLNAAKVEQAIRYAEEIVSWAQQIIESHDR
jgi:HEPN domain-containing protein